MISAVLLQASYTTPKSVRNIGVGRVGRFGRCRLVSRRYFGRNGGIGRIGGIGWIGTSASVGPKGVARLGFLGRICFGVGVGSVGIGSGHSVGVGEMKGKQGTMKR